MTDKKKDWFLERHVDSDSLRRIEIDRSPFRIGREGPEVELALPEAGVSRLHAELEVSKGSLFVRDLRSTNGTFVNRQRVEAETRLQRGDILHVGKVELRVGWDESDVEQSWRGETVRIGGVLTQQFPGGSRELRELIDSRSVKVLFQPIVASDSRERVGHELLGRGSHPKLAAEPGPLFDIARSIGAETELSRLFREVGTREASESGLDGKLFLNALPEELKDQEDLVEQFRELREDHPALDIVFEVNESAVVDLQAMSTLQDELHNLGIQVAYDDFGVGQSRLMELVETPPDYVKLDIALITGLDQGAHSQTSLVDMVLKLAKEFGIETIAEGVSSEAEAHACLVAGFDYLQGFHVGKPGPLPR